MTYVGSVGSSSVGGRDTQPQRDPAASPEAVPEPAAAPPGDDQADLLMGFLADFRAAGREPEPQPDPVGPRQVSSGSSPLSRFQFAPPDPLDVHSDLEVPPAAPLPVWPPVPGSDPATAPAPAAPAAAQSDPPPQPGPEIQAHPGEEGTGRRGINVFRRMGRR